MDAEKAHEFTMSSLHWGGAELGKLMRFQTPSHLNFEVELKCGIKWKFPVGIAAGLDKNAVAIPFFSHMGIGALEVGTVTPKAQSGNPKPRLFRLPQREGLLNRLGFNNLGLDKVKKNILCSQAELSKNFALGGNFGKNKVTSEEDAREDYKVLLENLGEHLDYGVINVSSPNTPGLRDLQAKGPLEAIIRHLESWRSQHDLPLFIKVSPDQSYELLDSVIELAIQYKCAGIIATNTTIMEDVGVGGVSGKPLKQKSQKVREYLLSKTKDTQLDLIGVGGFSQYEDLVAFWKQGGRVAQVYTAFIYQGPGIFKSMAQEIQKDLELKSLKKVQELISFYQAGTSTHEA